VAKKSSFEGGRRFTRKFVSPPLRQRFCFTNAARVSGFLERDRILAIFIDQGLHGPSQKRPCGNGAVSTQWLTEVPEAGLINNLARRALACFKP
jgi:hypothetical protein